MTAKEHNNVLSILFFVNAGLLILTGLIVLVIYAVVGAAIFSSATDSEGQTMGGIFIVISVFMGFLMVIFAALYIFTGLKMRKTQKIGRILGIIVSILSLSSVPLGTALGIYGLWFLFGEEGKRLYEDGGMMSPNSPPPPPNSWQ